MLVPAILHKEQIEKGFRRYYYTTDMMYETGNLCNWNPEIAECPNESRFQYAVVDENEKLIGYLEYSVDWYSSTAYNFCMLSFDRGNPQFGIDVYNKLEELVNRFRRMEWHAVSGNPACRSYGRFVAKHGGCKHVLKYAIRDREGKYHDDIIYEIVNEE